MSSDAPEWLRRRPPGVSSRLRPGEGDKASWVSDSGVSVELPVLLDLIEVDRRGDRVLWWVVAEIGLHDHTPVVTRLSLGAEEGLDLIRLQSDFRWQTPLDVVTRIVPRLISQGIDPFAWDFPVSGYPEVSVVHRTDGRRLSDEFLEDIAREYLQSGRGYAKTLAEAHHVSESTIASWIHKARERGIITDTRRGAKGGLWVRREDRPAPKVPRPKASRGAESVPFGEQ